MESLLHSKRMLQSLGLTRYLRIHEISGISGISGRDECVKDQQMQREMFLNMEFFSHFHATSV